MLRKLFVAGCLGAFVLSLSACSSGGDPTKVEMGDKERIDENKEFMEKNQDEAIKIDGLED